MNMVHKSESKEYYGYNILEFNSFNIMNFFIHDNEF